MPSTAAGKKAPQMRVKQAAHAMTATTTNGSLSPATSPSTLVAYFDEDHPTGPMVHAGSRVLICGTFPPVKKSIHFYYPNKNNNMWRILGDIFYDETSHFYTTRNALATGNSKIVTCDLDEARIRHFAGSAPIGFFDVCSRIRRRSGNSSDANIDTLRRTDVFHDVLAHTPRCEAIVTTGTLALTMLLDALHAVGSFTDGAGAPVLAVTLIRGGKVKYNLPRVGEKLHWLPGVCSPFQGVLCVYRAPSTSCALPWPLLVKREMYRSMFAAHQIP